MAVTWSLVADELAPYLMPRAEAEKDWFNPIAFGAAWDGTTDDSAAIQACIVAAEAVADNATNGRIQTVFFPSGMARANGLVVSSANVRIVAHGAVIKSFAAQDAPEFMLTFDGDFDEGGHIQHGSIVGLTLIGANHTNVKGLHLRGCSHMHLFQTRYRDFNGTGAGCALLLEESYDCIFWGGFMDYCGLNGGSLAASTAATQILSSTIDSCNQVYFYGFTWENNRGVDVAFLAPSGNAFPGNAISFIGCKWEHNIAQTLYAALYAPQSIANCITLEGKNYFAGYYRDGGAIDLNLAASAKFFISDSTEFGQKTGFTVGGAPMIKLRGTGKALIGGRMSDTIAESVTFLDTETKDPLEVEFSSVTVSTPQRKGWIWKTKDGSSSRVITDGGRLKQLFRLPANSSASFFPRGESGQLDISHHDQPTDCARASYRCELGGSGAAPTSLGNGGGVVFGTGPLPNGGTTTTADRIHVNCDPATGHIWVQNRRAFSAVLFLETHPTYAF